MRGTAPLFGAVTGLAHQSCSRIPHLRVHILSKKSRTKLPQPNALPGSKTQQRSRSTWISLDAAAPGEPLPVHHRKTAKPDHESQISTSTESAQGAVAKDGGGRSKQENVAGFSLFKVLEKLTGQHTSSAQKPVETVLPASVLDVLQEGNPERILFALLDPAIGPKFIREMDDEVFAQALSLISPQYLVEPYRDIFRFIKPALDRSVRTLEDRFDCFAASLNKIILQRQQSGHSLTLDVYRHLLDCARVMGDGPMATHVLDSMMPDDNVKPDLDCYNYYMEAICWSNAFSQVEKFRLRVTPRILAIRGSNNPPPDLSGHSVARPGQNPQRRQLTLRLRTLNKFRDLVAQGFQGDEATFTNLMVAMGREGQLDDAKSVLKSVWNIDVDLLATYDEEEIESPTFYEGDSPLRPTSRLLFTVAHVFGSNNNVGLALTLVDYISRNYNLRVPVTVWTHLCEWTMLQSLKRYGIAKKQGQGLSKVDPQVFPRLWEAMTDKPHNVVPDVVLLMIYQRTQREFLILDKTVEQIRQARGLLEQERASLETLTDQMLAMIGASLQGAQWDGFVSSAFLELRRHFLLRALKVDRDRHLLIFCLRRFFTRMGWNFAGSRADWERKRLPLLVEEFAEFLPNVMRYTLRSGVVELETQETRLDALRTSPTPEPGGTRHASSLTTSWAELLRKIRITRAALETDDHTKLVRNIQRLPWALQSRSKYCFSCERSGHNDGTCRQRSVWPVENEGGDATLFNEANAEEGELEDGAARSRDEMYGASKI